MSFLRGFPMLSCGDEIVQLNGWEYKEDPDRVEDSRSLHLSPFNWENVAKRKQTGTLQKQMWDGLRFLRWCAMLKDALFSDCSISRPHVRSHVLIRMAISCFPLRSRWNRTRFAWSKNNYCDFDLRLLRECV